VEKLMNKISINVEFLFILQEHKDKLQHMLSHAIPLFIKLLRDVMSDSNKINHYQFGVYSVHRERASF
jgi:hypothetical protein